MALFGGLLGSGISINDILAATGLSNLVDVAKGMAYGTMQGIGFDKATACKVAENLDPAYLLKYLRETMCTVFQGMTQCSVCNPVIVSGLCFTKELLGFLKHLRGDVVAGLSFIGKAGIKIAFHLPIEIRAVEHIVDYLLDWACPTKLPKEGEIAELALRQEIKPDHYRCLTKLQGLSPYFVDKVLHAKREKVGHNEVIEYFKRHPELHDETDKYLKRQGWIDDNERGMIVDLFTEIPDINRHFEWLRRNADSSIFVAEFGLWQGFDTRENVIALYNEILNDPDTSPERKTEIAAAIPIIQAQPINPALATRNYWNAFGRDIQSKGWTKKNTFYAYVAHFLPVPREMGYEFVQRLRPGRVDPKLVFTKDTLRRVLNEQDIDPNMIDRYIYTSYRTLNQRYIQMLAKLGLIDEKEIGERLQDIGFDPASSKILAHGLELQRRQQVATEFHGWNAANILAKLKDHLITKEQARNGLKYLGATDADIDQSFAVLDLHKDADMKNEWKKVIRDGFMKGFYDASTAQQVLVNAKFDVQQAADLLELWKTQRSFDIHNPSAHDLIDALVKGFIDVDEVATRLVRMNYSYDSISLLIAGAILKIQQAEEKDIDKRTRQKEALAKELAKQMKDQQKQIYRQEKIKLSVTKAQERANLVLMKAEAKASASYAKSLLKLSTIAGLAKAKDDTSQALLRIAQEAKSKIADIKNQLAIDVEGTKDTVEKAQMKKTANEKILKIQEQAQEDAERVKSVLAVDQTLAQSALVVGPVPPPMPNEQQVAAVEGATIVSDAEAEAKVEADNP